MQVLVWVELVEKKELTNVLKVLAGEQLCEDKSFLRTHWKAGKK